MMFVLVDALIDQLAKDHKVACSIQVTRGDQAIYERAVDNDMDAIYLVASLTKSFTGAAVMKLVEQKKLTLGDTLHSVIPEYPQVNLTDGFGHEVTISNLLSHTSAIPNVYESPAINAKMWNEVISFDDVLNAIKGQKLKAGVIVGSTFEYENTNYVLLGEVIRRKSGLTYGEFLKRFVLPAAELSQVTVGEPREPGLRKAAPSSMKVKENHTTDVFTDGNLYMSVKDLAKWTRAVTSGTVLSPEMRKEYLKPHKDDYAAGWFSFVTKSGEPAVNHSGGWMTYKTFVQRYLDRDVTIALSCNKVESEDRDAIIRAIVEAVAPLKN